MGQGVFKVQASPQQPSPGVNLTGAALRDVSIALAAAALTIGLLESALKLCGTRFDGAQSSYDSQRYWALVKESGFWAHEEGQEQFVTTNRDGYRDVNHAMICPPQTLRVAVLGDSLTTGFQVPFDDTYPEVAEREYNRFSAGPLKAEFMNFGVFAYSLQQELLTLEKDVLKYRPNVVVLQINQTWAVYRSTPKTQWQFPVPFPNYEYKDGKIVASEATRREISANRQSGFDWRARLNRSQLYCIYHSLQLRADDFLKRRRGVYRVIAQHDLDAVSPPGNPDLAEAWRVAEGLILTIRSEVESSGASFLLVIADLPQLSTPSAKQRAEFLAGLKHSDGTYAEKRFTEFAQANGIHVIVLSGPVRRAAEVTGRSMHTSLAAGHWSIEGHAVVGKIIAHALLQDF